LYLADYTNIFVKICHAIAGFRWYDVFAGQSSLEKTSGLWLACFYLRSSALSLFIDKNDHIKFLFFMTEVQV